MKGKERRQQIIELLNTHGRPVNGTYLSQKLMVSRQVIVQDIAILRAKGTNIIATPRGYIIPDYPESRYLKRIIACIHDNEGIEDELNTIISCGGRVIDVMVEHPLYGELRGMLMLFSKNDVDDYINKLRASNGKPLLVLTGGVHLHTIEADSIKKLDMIEDKLREKGYFLDTKV
ncbi:MAG: transcription repressor NadR [Clostridiales bacterium]|nr:transcription repressor NadR [Clostridiales bacterium]HBM80934.1 transcription repressor NadR [Clostridiaceae bacterium]